MRRLLVLAAFLPATLLLANACGDDAPDEPPIQDLCGWVGDPENWQIMRPTTDWQLMKAPMPKDAFQVATDLYYVNVVKQ